MEIFKQSVDPISLSDREAIKLINPIGGPIDRTYQGDSPFADIIKDYMQSGLKTNVSTADSVYNPIYQTHGSSSDLSAMKKFIDDQFATMQTRLKQQDIKPPEFYDRLNLYRDARFALDGSKGQEGQFGQLELPSQVSPGVTEPPLSGLPGVTQPEPPLPGLPGLPTNETTNFLPDTIPPSFQPPGFQPPNMGSNHSHDDLLKGIGDLFKQYFPNQGQSSQSNFGQSNFPNNFGYAQPNGPGILGLILPQRS